MKIAILCLQGLGDALMATPLIRLVRARFPSSTIHGVVLRRICAELLGDHPALDRVHLLPYWDEGSARFLRAIPRLRSERFDVSILAYPTPRSEYHLVSFAIGAKRRIAHDYRPLGRTLTFLETDRVAIDERVHNVLNNAALLEPLGGLASRIPAAYDIPPSWQPSAERQQAVGIHVGSIMHKGNENKRWPIERFIEVGQVIANRGYRVRFIRGPQESEATDKAVASVPGSDIIEGDVATVARAIGKLRVVIAGDNGIAHLSAAVGTHCIVLFGLTNPLHVAPWGSNVTVVRPSDCPPCFTFGDPSFACKRHIDFRCLRTDLRTEHVLEAFSRLEAASKA